MNFGLTNVGTTDLLGDIRKRTYDQETNRLRYGNVIFVFDSSASLFYRELGSPVMICTIYMNLYMYPPLNLSTQVLRHTRGVISTMYYYRVTPAV